MYSNIGRARHMVGGGLTAPHDQMIAAGGTLARQGSFSCVPRRSAIIAPPPQYCPRLDLGERRFARHRIQLRLS